MKLKYTKNNVHEIADVRLVPGLNIIPADKVEALKAHPHFQFKVDKGAIQIIEDAEDDAPERSVKDILADLPQINDPVYLKKLTEDKRSTVSKAAQKRLDELLKDEDAEDDVE